MAVVTEALNASAESLLKAKLPGELEKAASLRPEPEKLDRATILVIRSRTIIDKNLLEQAPHLKLIVTATSGFDHIDYKECEKRGIAVSYTPEANAASAAELTLTLLLALSKNLHLAQDKMRHNKWRDSVPRGQELAGKTIGLVGLGRTGNRVAKATKALGMEVMAYDPYLEDDTFSQYGAIRCGLNEMLRSADVCSLHVPLTKETFYMIDRPQLELMNPELLLINASRGAVINETALVEALDQGRPKGVALDVFEREPLVSSSSLRGRSNVLLSPHLGAYTEQARERASHQAVEQVLEFINGATMSNQLPLSASWFAQWLKLHNKDSSPDSTENFGPNR